jgi:hypothetical protein
MLLHEGIGIGRGTSVDCHKADLLALLKPPPPPAPTAALRAAYRRWFELTVAEADGQRITPAEARALQQEIMRLTDDAGPFRADAVFADELRRFRLATARCGVCGGLGHDGPHGQED